MKKIPYQTKIVDVYRQGNAQLPLTIKKTVQEKIITGTRDFGYQC